MAEQEGRKWTGRKTVGQISELTYGHKKCPFILENLEIRKV